MKNQISSIITKLEIMRDTLQDRIDNAGDSDKSQELMDRNQTILDYIESAIDELESAVNCYD